jgi:hypothetical protein
VNKKQFEISFLQMANNSFGAFICKRLQRISLPFSPGLAYLANSFCELLFGKKLINLYSEERKDLGRESSLEVFHQNYNIKNIGK